MDWDEKPKPKPTITIGEDLKTLSIAELEARMAAHVEEIRRIEAEIMAKRKHGDAAASVFKR
jgi:uncharacterized small protein (DUF1192 family)